MAEKRGYGIGLQWFPDFIEREAIYVDKTAYVYKLAHRKSKNYFLSRPRRFGKSLLVSTLQCYFEGRKELFRGLAINKLETEWTQYPVIRIDLSNGKYFNIRNSLSTIDGILRRIEEKWGITNVSKEASYNDRLTEVIQAAHKQTGKQVVVLIDEYDAPMLDSMHKPELQDELRDIYNPWSVFYAFEQGLIDNYWFSTGTPSSLINLIKVKHLDTRNLESINVPIEVFDAPTERISDPIPALFQSGYLTIKGYNAEENTFTLGFPNQEVYLGFAKSLYKYYCEEYVGSDYQMGNVFRNLRYGRITFEQFLEAVQKWYAGIPYSITDRNQNEQFYQSLFYSLMVGIGADVEAEGQTSDGRYDIALKLKDAIYILEFKFGKTTKEATRQMLTKDYAVRFAADSRPVYAVGLNISPDHRTIESYEVVECK